MKWKNDKRAIPIISHTQDRDMTAFQFSSIIAEMGFGKYSFKNTQTCKRSSYYINTNKKFSIAWF